MRWKSAHHSYKKFIWGENLTKDGKGVKWNMHLRFNVHPCALEDLTLCNSRWPFLIFSCCWAAVRPARHLQAPQEGVRRHSCGLHQIRNHLADKGLRAESTYMPVKSKDYAKHTKSLSWVYTKACTFCVRKCALCTLKWYYDLETLTMTGLAVNEAFW